VAKKKSKKNKPQNSSPSNDEGVVTGGQWSDKKSLRWRDFPIREEIDEPIRVTFSPEAYAELISLAKAKLDTEICGVLAGEFCQDDYGMYLFVGAVIEGSTAEQGAAHVTYTQETWNEIHQRMDSEYRKYEIVGWYHTHPGFGVSFSDMDLFIQENFFSGPGQIAYVSDPLGGEEAICVNTAGGVKNVSQFWVDDRPRRCSGAKPDSSGGSADTVRLAEAVESMEQRLRQTLQSVDALRTNYYRFLGLLGMIVALGVTFWIGLSIHRMWTADDTPPQIQSFSQAPVKVGGKWCWIGSKVVALDMSPQHQAQLQELERAQFLAAETKRQENSSAPAATQPTTRPATRAATPSGAISITPQLLKPVESTTKPAKDSTL